MSRGEGPLDEILSSLHPRQSEWAKGCNKQPLSFGGLTQLKFISPHVKSCQRGFREASALCSSQRPGLALFYGSCGTSGSCPDLLHLLANTGQEGDRRGLCRRLCRPLSEVPHVTSAYVPLAKPLSPGQCQLQGRLIRQWAQHCLVCVLSA